MITYKDKELYIKILSSLIAENYNNLFLVINSPNSIE